jgi:hypothetical protein
MHAIYRYGLPFVSPNNILVSTINGTGSVIEAIYVVIFLIFAVDRRARLRMLGLLSIVVSIFATVVLVSLLALHGNARKVFCGLAATIFSICMYASPLSIMVSKQRSMLCIAGYKLAPVPLVSARCLCYPRHQLIIKSMCCA